MSKFGNPNIFYDKASKEELKTDYWGYIPKSIDDAINYVINNDEKNVLSDNKFNLLSTILRNYHKKLGIYSNKFETNLAKLRNGSIITGQQPIIIGGPGYIANKLSTLIKFDDEFQKRKHHLSPIFFIADYDGLHKEISKQYFPNPISHKAYHLDFQQFYGVDANTAVHSTALPPEEYFKDLLSSFENNLNGFKKLISTDKRKLFTERWDHIKTLLLSSFYNSTTISELFTIIWGTITNIINDYGIIFFPTSNTEIRKLIYSEYNHIVNRIDDYITNYKLQTKKLENNQLSPPLPNKESDYSPFILECNKDKNRLQTSIHYDGKHRNAIGKCNFCKKTYNYPINNLEDFEKISEIIGPRVDTSQVVFQKLLNIQLRISGPGEIAYFSQITRPLQKIGYQTPIYYKYKRVFYNTSWLEQLGKSIHEKNGNSIHQNVLFRILKERSNYLKKNNINKIRLNDLELNNFLQTQFNNLEKNNDLETSKYIGWQFGKFNKQKFGQEVSWSWFDLCIQTGLSDYLNTYIRSINIHSYPGGINYINSML